jgi:hypothetical protein
MVWIKENTSEESAFLVLTGEKAWQTDEVSEWFPSLTARVSQATVQGYEWFPNHEDRGEWYDELQNCVNDDFTCIEEWSEETEQPFTHIYVSHTDECCFELRNALEDSSDYVELFREKGVIIFERR